MYQMWGMWHMGTLSLLSLDHGELMVSTVDGHHELLAWTTIARAPYPRSLIPSTVTAP